MAVQNQLTRYESRGSVNALPSPEHDKKAVLAASTLFWTGNLCTRVGDGAGGLQATWPFFRPSLG